MPAAPRSLVLIMGSNPAGSLCGLPLRSTPRRAFLAFDRRLAVYPGPPRAPTPVPTVLTRSDRDRAEPLSAPFSGLSTPSGPASALTADLNALGAAAELLFGGSAARYSHANRERGKHAGVLCRHPIRSSRPAKGPAYQSFGAFPLAPAPPLLGDSGARWQRPPPYYRRRHFSPRPSSNPDPLLRTTGGMCGLPFELRTNLCSCAVTHAPVNHASLPCSISSCHLGTARTLRMIQISIGRHE